MVHKQIAYWKDLSPLELWVAVMTMVGVWAKILNWLLSTGGTP